jgi:hypothetical protein
MTSRLENPSVAGRPRNILIIGAERPDEFAAAERYGLSNCVTVSNPRVTPAARIFWSRGGSFWPSPIANLPPDRSQFDEIREHYPYPSGRHYVPPLPFLWERLSRLAPGGRWILYTESPRYASLLVAAIAYHPRLAPRFKVRFAKLPLGAAPPSGYPQRATRYRLIFKRRR